MIFVAVKEDDLDSVPVVAGPLGAFYEKLRPLLLKILLRLPFKRSCFFRGGFSELDENQLFLQEA